VEAGRILLYQMVHLAAQKVSFAFETTLSAKNYLNRIDTWKKIGYDIHLIFLSLPSPAFAIDRVRQRVKQGGHHIPIDVIRRRHSRGNVNLPAYKKLVNSWRIYDNSVVPMVLLEEGSNEKS
jgi:predicted ABC-type ATPase